MLVRSTDSLSQAERQRRANESRKRSQASESGRSSDSTQASSKFKDLLEDVLPTSNASNLELHQLWEEMASIEQSLISERSEANLQRYIKSVQAIASATLKLNTRVETITQKSRHSRNDTISLQTVRIIDERLQKMALILSRSSAFEIMKKVEEIRGLLLDVRN